MRYELHGVAFPVTANHDGVRAEINRVFGSLVPASRRSSAATSTTNNAVDNGAGNRAGNNSVRTNAGWTPPSTPPTDAGSDTRRAIVTRSTTQVHTSGRQGSGSAHHVVGDLVLANNQDSDTPINEDRARDEESGTTESVHEVPVDPSLM